MPMIYFNDYLSANPQKKTSSPLNFHLQRGEHIALLGDNGSGKSLISDILRGLTIARAGESIFNMGNDRPLYENIAIVTFQSQYSSSNFFYQQRWNSTTYTDSPTISDEIAKFEYPLELASLLRIDELKDRYIVELSSGELRRFTLFKALACEPKVLFIDNLYVGLDEKMRRELNKVIMTLTTKGDLSIVSICSKVRDIPPCTTHIYRVENLALKEKEAFTYQDIILEKTKELALSTCTSGASVVDFESINISYGERVLFRDFSWQINQGERWLLTGDNGSGKTTLLSLINADNPIAYAQKMSLFGRKRGTGESIWDIKRRIGFLSPELLRSFSTDSSVKSVVASGFLDFNYLKANDEQMAIAFSTMKDFEISHLADRSFNKLSSGEKRMVLAARAFVKSPELMILDEPFHDLDQKNCDIISKMIIKYTEEKSKTIICVSHYPSDVPQIMTHHLHLIR